MKDLALIATASTPSVHTSREEGVLEMRGDSYPENTFEFYAPVVAWITDYLRQSDGPLRLRLHLLYLNTSSVKAMMDIFDLLEDAHGSGRPVEVRWYYDGENERIAELAGEFREDCTFPFEIVLAEA
ncbi:MAG TPA: biofilm regulation phosphoprotein SiaC [Deinococcales bacterium]|nr:biofilm regulation phosphoprotein SiaC [Deinococcales bacterium]